MTRFLRAGYGAASLLLMACNAAPSFAADAVGVARPEALPAVTTPLPLPDAQPDPSLASVEALEAPVLAPGVLPVRFATPTLLAFTFSPSPAVPLRDLVVSFVDRRDQDAEQTCLANAVYFEARSEPLEGQLAVAQVVLNRAASGTFPTSVCDVVLQPAQFSFVRRGKLPPADKTSACWHRALAIADIARKRTLVGEIASNVLWYHATYVSPAWGRQRTRFAQIGRHIFFS